jgi:hypothetical protein
MKLKLFYRKFQLSHVYITKKKNSNNFILPKTEGSNPKKRWVLGLDLDEKLKSKKIQNPFFFGFLNSKFSCIKFFLYFQQILKKQIGF